MNEKKIITKPKSRWTKTDKTLSKILIESGAVTIGELINVFKESTKDRNYSGQFRIRVPRTLHKHLVMKAKVQGISLNTYVIHLLTNGVQFSDVK